MKVRLYLSVTVDVPSSEDDPCGYALANYDPDDVEYESWEVLE